MRRPIRTCLLAVAVSFVVLILTVVIFSLQKPPPSSPLPNPNGYDDLLKAVQLMTERMNGAADLNHDGLRELVVTNAEALRRLRQGLSRKCDVPTEATISNFGNISSDLIGLKSLARLLAAEGRLAEMEDRPADAARSYVDAIRLGAAMSRGGLMINRLVGIACQGVGSIPLVKLIPKLSCEQMQPLVAELEQVDTDTVTWQEVLENEDRWVRAQRGSIPNPIRMVSDWWQARSMRKVSEGRHDLAVTRLRLLIMELALRCYRCDHGNAPSRLDELSPKYLQQLPPDPFGSRTLAYRQDGTNWVLYSLGPDKTDDGGASVGRIISDDYLIGFGIGTSGKDKKKGDLLYDSPW